MLPTDRKHTAFPHHTCAICVSMCVYTHIYVRVHTCVAHMCTHVHLICIYTHIYIYIQTWFVTQYRRLLLFFYHWGHIFYKRHRMGRARKVVSGWGQCYANKVLCMKWLLLPLPFAPHPPPPPPWPTRSKYSLLAAKFLLGNQATL